MIYVWFITAEVQQMLQNPMVQQMMQNLAPWFLVSYIKRHELKPSIDSLFAYVVTFFEAA